MGTKSMRIDSGVPWYSPVHSMWVLSSCSKRVFLLVEDIFPSHAGKRGLKSYCPKASRPPRMSAAGSTHPSASCSGMRPHICSARTLRAMTSLCETASAARAHRSIRNASSCRLLVM